MTKPRLAIGETRALVRRRTTYGWRRVRHRVHRQTGVAVPCAPYAFLPRVQLRAHTEGRAWCRGWEEEGDDAKALLVAAALAETGLDT